MLERARFYSCVVVVAVFLVPVFLVTASRAADWPQFRGPGSQGVSDAKNLPASWSDDENVLWKTALPGAGASSPITLGDKIYLTCYSGYGRSQSGGDLEDLKLHVVCLKQAGGDLVWDRKIKPSQGESKRVKDHGYAAATPATDGEHLFVFFGKSGVFKFDLDGKEIWRTSVGSKTHGWGCGTSPVLYKGLVIVNASVESRSMVALDKKTGDEVWRAGGMRSSWNTPHLVDVKGGKQELVVSVKGRILGFDPASGEELWSCQGIPDYVCPSVVSHDGIIYALGGRSSHAIAVRAGGRGDVTDSHRLWDKGVGANVSSPVVHDGHLYWVSDRKKIAYCLRLKDGSLVYEKRVSGQPYASTMLADGKLYVVTRYSGTLVLAAKPGFEQLAHNELDDGSTFNASAIVAGGNLLLRSDKYLYCIGKKS